MALLEDKGGLKFLQMQMGFERLESRKNMLPHSQESLKNLNLICSSQYLALNESREDYDNF